MVRLIDRIPHPAFLERRIARPGKQLCPLPDLYREQQACGLDVFHCTAGKRAGREAKKEFLPLQPGDVVETYADIDDLVGKPVLNPLQRLKKALPALLNGINLITENKGIHDIHEQLQIDLSRLASESVLGHIAPRLGFHQSRWHKLSQRVDWWLAWKGNGPCLWPVCMPDNKSVELPLFTYYVGPMWSQIAYDIPVSRWLASSMQVYGGFIKLFIEKYNRIKTCLPVGLTDVRVFDWWNYGERTNRVLQSNPGIRHGLSRCKI